MEEKEEPTYPCPVCDRNFVQRALQKHEPICRKSSTKKRKAFDSGKQRAAGSDIPLNDVRKVQEEIKKNRGGFKPPKTAWRERHEQFMTAVSSAKGVDYALKTGTPLPPPPKATVPSDYVRCDFCGRNFNRNAAERHIPFCKEQNARQKQKMPMGGGGALNKQRNNSIGNRQPLVATYTQETRKIGNGNIMKNIKASSAVRADSHDIGKEKEQKKIENGRKPRSISAGRAYQAPSHQSRVPVPQRRGISPVRRVSSNAKTG